MKYLPPLKSLQYFMVAARHQSFKAAAQELYVSQAAVSQQIRHLESLLDVTLFKRHGQTTRLTEMGYALLPYMEKGFDALEQGVMSVMGDPEPNLLRLSAMHSFTSLWLLPRLEGFQQQHKDITVQLSPANQLVDFHDGVTDLAIRMGPGGYHPLVEKHLTRDELILVASPRLVKGIDVFSPDAVFSLPWVEDSSRDVQAAIDDCCHRYGVDRTGLLTVFKSDNSVPLIENALAGRGFALVNAGLAADHLFSGRLVRVLEYSFPSPYSLFLVAPAQHFRWPKVKAFEEWLTPRVRETYSDIQNWLPSTLGPMG